MSAEEGAPGPAADATTPFDATRLTGSVEGIVESVKDIGQKLQETQAQLSTHQKDTIQAAEEAKEAKTQMEGHHASQEQKLEELQKQVTEMNEALKTLIEEKTTNIDEQQKQAVKNLEDAFSVRLAAAEKGVEELGARHTEIEIKALPKYWADACAEDKKVLDELAAHKAKAEDTARELEAKMSTTAKDLLELRELSEKRLLEEAAPLKQRLGTAEEVCVGLAGDLTKESAKLEALLQSTRAELEAADKQLEAQAKESSQAILDSIRSGEGARLETLEGVVRQAEFERLGFADRIGKELETIRSSVTSSGETAGAQLQAGLRRASEEFQAVEEALQKQMATAAADTKTAFAKVEEARGQLAGEIRSESAKLQDLIQLTKSQLEAADKNLAQHSVVEASKVLNVVHAEETVRLGKLEELFQQAQGKLGEQVEAFQRDFASVHECIRSVDQAHEQRLTAADAAATQRQQAAAQVVEALAQEFHDFVVQQESKDNESARLETLVRALELRVWPWRNAARDRSQTPPRHQPQQVDEHGSPIAWHGWTKSSPYSPSTAMSRPQSANRLPKRDPREEKDTSFSVPSGSAPTPSPGKATSQGSVAAPVGAAHAVARANARSHSQAHAQAQHHQR